METPILRLQSIAATCFSSSAASWVIGTILRILYGLGLFLLFFPPPKRHLPSRPPGNRRNVRKVRHPGPRPTPRRVSLLFDWDFRFSESTRGTPGMGKNGTPSF